MKKSLVLFSLLCIGPFAGVVHASSAGSGLSWLNLGKEAEKEHDNRKASTAFNRAAGFGDTHDEAVIAEARLLLKEGSADQAFLVINKLVQEESPFNVEARQALVEVLHGQKKYEAALQMVASIETLHPGYLPARAEKGMILFDMKKSEDAIASLTGALKDTPNAHPLRIKRAQTYVALGMYEKAIEDFEIVAKQKPEDSEIQMFLADAYFSASKFQRAAEIYTKITQFNPTLSIAWEKLGDSDRKLNRVKESVDLYKKAAELEPNRFEVGQKLADAYVQVGLKPKAEEEYRRELTLDPGNDVASRGLTALLDERHDAVATGLYLRELTEHFPDKVWASVRYAKILANLGNIDYAERVARTNAKMAGEPAETLVVIAQIKTEQNKKAEAFTILSNAEKKYPHDAGVKFALASFYDQDGNVNEALAKFHEVEGDASFGTQAREKISSIEFKSGAQRMPAAITAPVKSEDIH